MPPQTAALHLPLDSRAAPYAPLFSILTPSAIRERGFGKKNLHQPQEKENFMAPIKELMALSAAILAAICIANPLHPREAIRNFEYRIIREVGNTRTWGDPSIFSKHNHIHRKTGKLRARRALSGNARDTAHPILRNNSSKHNAATSPELRSSGT